MKLAKINYLKTNQFPIIFLVVCGSQAIFMATKYAMLYNLGSKHNKFLLSKIPKLAKTDILVLYNKHLLQNNAFHVHMKDFCSMNFKICVLFRILHTQTQTSTHRDQGTDILPIMLQLTSRQLPSRGRGEPQL